MTISDSDWQEISKYYRIYFDKENKDIESFTNIMLKETNLDKEVIEIIWKSFDIATYYCLTYGNILKEITNDV